MVNIPPALASNQGDMVGTLLPAPCCLLMFTISKSPWDIGQIWHEGRATEVFPLLEAVQPYVEGAHGRLMQCHDLSVGGIWFRSPFPSFQAIPCRRVTSCNLYQVWTVESASHACTYKWHLSSVWVIHASLRGVSLRPFGHSKWRRNLET